MLVLNFNVNNEDTTLLPQNRDSSDYVSSLVICNEFAGSLHITIYKTNDVEEITAINDIILTEKESFVLEQLSVEKEYGLHAEVLGGPASIILEYYHS